MAVMTFNTLGRQMPQGRDYGSQIVRAGMMREERKKRMDTRAALASFEAETGRQAVDVDRISARAQAANVAQQQALKELGVEGALKEQRLRNVGEMQRASLASKSGLEQSRIATAPGMMRAKTEAGAVEVQRETDEPLARLGVHRAFQGEGLESPFAEQFGETLKVAEPSGFKKALELEGFEPKTGVKVVPGEEAEYGFGPKPLSKKAYKKRPSLYSKMFGLGG